MKHARMRAVNAAARTSADCQHSVPQELTSRKIGLTSKATRKRHTASTRASDTVVYTAAYDDRCTREPCPASLQHATLENAIVDKESSHAPMKTSQGVACPALDELVRVAVLAWPASKSHMLPLVRSTTSLSRSLSSEVACPCRSLALPNAGEVELCQWPAGPSPR